MFLIAFSIKTFHFYFLELDSVLENQDFQWIVQKIFHDFSGPNVLDTDFGGGLKNLFLMIFTWGYVLCFARQ